MKAFVSWSGGKDCMLALYKVQQNQEHEVLALVNMCDADGEHSRSHGIHKNMVKFQAKAIGIPILQPMSTFKAYEDKFKETIEDIKNYGVEAGIFGDIYSKPHRDWIERVCGEMDITAIFPLWGENTNDLLNEFIDFGFETIVVSVNKNMLSKDWLGRVINAEFLNDIKLIEGIDACAENGEYHSFVFNGPNFKLPLNLKKGESFQKDDHWYMFLSIV